MKILFLHRWTGVHEGGSETHIKNIMNYFCSRGHDVSLMTRNGSNVSNLRKKIKVYTVPKLPFESDFSYKSMSDPRLYFYTFAFMALLFLRFLYVYLVEGARFDLISVHFLTESKVARLIRFFFGIPFVFSLEGYTRAEASEARRADLVFAVSADIASLCQKNFGFSPIVKTHGVNMNIFNEKVDGSAIRKKYGLVNCFVFLTVCRLEPRKDISTLLLSAKEFLSRHSHVYFLIVGEGVAANELRSQARQLGIESNVIFTGRVPDEELSLYYAAGNVFVLPTLYEGFGIVFAEAMAVGLPIISTNTSAVPDVVGNAGILFTPKNIDELTSALEKIYSDKDLCADLKKKALQRAKQEFDLEKLLPIYEQNCLRLVTGRERR
jgi:glycosyltransferase involved in cell wall biosynthesis